MYYLYAIILYIQNKSNLDKSCKGRTMIKYKKIIFFKGAYSTLDLFTDYMIESFNKIGFSTMVFDTNDIRGSFAKLAQFAVGNVDAVITFNNLGFVQELEEGHILWDQLRIPCINILMDHPLCYRSTILNRPIRSLFLTIDRNHVKYLNRFYPGVKAAFMPHQGLDFPNIPLKPLSQRNTNVLYVGSLSVDMCQGIMPDFTKFTDFDPHKLSSEVINYLLQNTSVTLEDAIEKWLIDNGHEYDDNTLADIITDYRYIECYVTSYFREKSVEVLVNAGIDVEVYGRGWDNRPCFSNPHFIYRGLVSATEAVEKMYDSKIVLNTLTWFKDGTHDRIYNAMFAKAVALTETSIYLSETLHNNTDAVLFSLDEIDTLPDKVNHLLTNIDEAQAIADAGYDLANKYYSTDCRVMELLTYLDR